MNRHSLGLKNVADLSRNKTEHPRAAPQGLSRTKNLGKHEILFGSRGFRGDPASPWITSRPVIVIRNIRCLITGNFISLLLISNNRKLQNTNNLPSLLTIQTGPSIHTTINESFQKLISNRSKKYLNVKYRLRQGLWKFLIWKINISYFQSEMV